MTRMENPRPLRIGNALKREQLRLEDPVYIARGRKFDVISSLVHVYAIVVLQEAKVFKGRTCFTRHLELLANEVVDGFGSRFPLAS
jgi:hypothetical protein